MLTGPASDPLTWLHLTDLHVGQPRENDRYHNIARALRDDLERLHRDDGWRWDIVFFTGDLAFRGEDSEYAGVTQRLRPILDDITRHNGGAPPVLITVPGNHDLRRPDPLTAARVGAAWRGSSVYREAFWRGGNPDLRAVLDPAFAAYLRWERSHPFRRPDRPQPGGLVPGDFAASLDIRGRRVGVVGLNSAFLHLGDAGPGELDLRLEQVRALCGDYDEWARSHDFRVLLTHHPIDWLSPEGRASVEEEVRHGDRFDIHLYGHMHAGAHAARPGVAGFRHHLQGCSLFGAEEDGNPRSHGYGMGRLAIDPGAGDARTMDLFTREGWRMDGHGWAFGPLAPSTRRNWYVRAELGPAPPRTNSGSLLGLDAPVISDPAELAPLLTRSGEPPGKLLFLSASVPVHRVEAERRGAEAEYVRSARPEAVGDAVRALCKHARAQGVQVVFGGHPSIAAALLPLALEPAGGEPWLILLQHLHFNWHLQDTTAALARCPGVKLVLVDGAAPDATSPTQARLAVLRECMLGAPGLIGAVFIGGMSGVADEYRAFRAAHPTLPTYALGLGGGAAAGLLAKHPLEARGRLPDSAPLWADPEAAAQAVIADLAIAP